MIEEARALYAADPTTFVRERATLKRSLEAAGRKDDASAVAALRRPKLSEWALNRVAHEHPPIVRRWVDAVAAARTAQSDAIGGGSGAALRAAADELKLATNALLDVAVGGVVGGGATARSDTADARRNDIAAVLRELGTGNGPALLSAGIVGSSPVAAEADMFPGAPEPAHRERSSRPQPSRSPRPSTAELRRIRDLRADFERLQVAVAAAEAAVTRARSDLAAAQRVLDDRQARLATVQGELDTVARELATADPDGQA
jgi:hypothetical protein